MSFGRNLQLLRRMRNRMTQESLAEKLGVSRQTISKWELDIAYPEMDKVLELCDLFSCSMDQLIREDMNLFDEAYSDIRIEQLEALKYIQYTVVSAEPEEDALHHVAQWASDLGIDSPLILGWDFPFLSQEQINVYNMHGYTAALILEDASLAARIGAELVRKESSRYLVITIRHPSAAPFRLIPNAYKAINAHMRTNGFVHRESPSVLSCFEKEYVKDGIDYMDVYIAIE